MSYNYGMAAINLEMTDRVPRVEYSAETHWDLVKAVTGIDVNSQSGIEVQQNATAAFKKAWNYDYEWDILTHNYIFNGKYTKMGHASYASDSVDFDNEISCLFEEPEDVIAFDFWKEFGERDIKQITKDFEEKYKSNCEKYSDTVNTTGIYISLMSGLIELLGWDMLLLTAGIYPEEFGDFANRYAEWIGQYFKGLSEASFPVVNIHDDIVWTEGPFLKPEWYRKYIFPNYKKNFAPLLEKNKKIIYTSDGNYNEFIDDIAACGVHGFVLEPLTDMQYVADKYGKTHVFIGNADTNVLLRGSKDDIYREVERCMDIGKNCPGFFMAVGNHIPSNTPVENALWYNECYEKLSKR